jgi:hypothetical protein
MNTLPSTSIKFFGKLVGIKKATLILMTLLFPVNYAVAYNSGDLSASPSSCESTDIKYNHCTFKTPDLNNGSKKEIEFNNGVFKGKATALCLGGSIVLTDKSCETVNESDCEVIENNWYGDNNELCRNAPMSKPLKNKETAVLPSILTTGGIKYSCNNGKLSALPLFCGNKDGDSKKSTPKKDKHKSTSQSAYKPTNINIVGKRGDGVLLNSIVETCSFSLEPFVLNPKQFYSSSEFDYDILLSNLSKDGVVSYQYDSKTKQDVYTCIGTAPEGNFEIVSTIDFPLSNGSTNSILSTEICAKKSSYNNLERVLYKKVNGNYVNYVVICGDSSSSTTPPPESNTNQCTVEETLTYKEVTYSYTTINTSVVDIENDVIPAACGSNVDLSLSQVLSSEQVDVNIITPTHREYKHLFDIRCAIKEQKEICSSENCDPITEENITTTNKFKQITFDSSYYDDESVINTICGEDVDLSNSRILSSEPGKFDPVQKKYPYFFEVFCTIKTTTTKPNPACSVDLGEPSFLAVDDCDTAKIRTKLIPKDKGSTPTFTEIKDNSCAILGFNKLKSIDVQPSVISSSSTEDFFQADVTCQDYTQKEIAPLSESCKSLDSQSLIKNVTQKTCDTIAVQYDIDVANSLNVNESTVCNLANGQYVFSERLSADTLLCETNDKTLCDNPPPEINEPVICNDCLKNDTVTYSIDGVTCSTNLPTDVISSEQTSFNFVNSTSNGSVTGVCNDGNFLVISDKSTCYKTCKGGTVSWGDSSSCSATIPSGTYANGATLNLTSIAHTGTSSVLCDGKTGQWVITNGSCKLDCNNNVSWRGVDGGGSSTFCSNTISGRFKSGDTLSLANTTYGYKGNTVASCNNGNISLTGSSCLSNCSGGTYNWGGYCSSSYPTITTGQSLTLNDGSLSSVKLTCNNGVISSQNEICKKPLRIDTTYTTYKETSRSCTDSPLTSTIPLGQAFEQTHTCTIHESRTVRKYQVYSDGSRTLISSNLEYRDRTEITTSTEFGELNEKANMAYCLSGDQDDKTSTINALITNVRGSRTATLGVEYEDGSTGTKTLGITEIQSTPSCYTTTKIPCLDPTTRSLVLPENGVSLSDVTYYNDIFRTHYFTRERNYYKTERAGKLAILSSSDLSVYGLCKIFSNPEF